jgi:hypothetical protein
MRVQLTTAKQQLAAMTSKLQATTATLEEQVG